MGNSEMRRLDKSILDEVIEELNPDFIKDLPQSPEIIFKFARRRVNPEISDNISYNLGKKMLDYRLSDKDYFITFLKVINDVFYGKTPTETVPQAQILISQTGAGKTNLRKKLLQEFPNTVIINSDLYKKFRPDADKIMQEDPTHFGALTGIDCYDHADNIVEFATKMKYNILTECAPSLKSGLIGVNIEKLRDRNYNTQFHVMAVGDMVSALAIHSRYEIDLASREPGAKLTDLKRHDESYEAVADAIKDLDPNSVNIYRRGNIQEGQIPINISEGIPNKNVVTLLQLLNRERNKSNYRYLESGRLRADYETIKGLMQERNAPDEQKRQLEQVYDKCVLRKEELKSFNNDVNQTCIDSFGRFE